MRSIRLVQKHYGFSLLEVLVALSLLAMLMGGLMRVSSATMQSVSVTEDYQMAVLVANSVLAEFDADYTSIVQHQSGVIDNSYHWYVSVKPYYNDTGHIGMAAPYEVSVTVEWGEGDHPRQISIVTVRLLRS